MNSIKNKIFLLIGFLTLWSLIISAISILFINESVINLFVINFIVFGLFGFLFSFILDRFINPKTNNQITILDEEEQEESILELGNADNKEEEIEILERISVKTGQKVDVINISDIMFLQSNGDYVSIYTNKNAYLKEQTMKYFEKHLPQKQFVRIHRSNIVNVDYISTINSYKKNQYLITLKNNHELKVSLAGYKLLKETLDL